MFCVCAPINHKFETLRTSTMNDINLSYDKKSIANYGYPMSIFKKMSMFELQYLIRKCFYKIIV